MKHESIALQCRQDHVRVEQRIKRVLEARRARDQFLPVSLFSDPAWDMLLEAYLAFLEQRRISVSALCHASRAPSTTGLRWLHKLEDEKLVHRTSDPFDARRSWVELSPGGVSAMAAYFDTVGAALSA